MTQKFHLNACNSIDTNNVSKGCLKKKDLLNGQRLVNQLPYPVFQLFYSFLSNCRNE